MASSAFLSRGLSIAIAILLVVSTVLSAAQADDLSNKKRRRRRAKKDSKTDAVKVADTANQAVAITATSTQNTASRATTGSVPRESILQISARIDELINQKLEADDLKRHAVIDDETFLRRIYLDVVGRIPTLAETNTFLDSKSKKRRQELIDDLLDSYGFVSHQFNYWADVLRLKSRINQVIGAPYMDFVKDSIESNMPYDQFVQRLLTAEGSMLGKDSAAVGYFLRDRNMPEDNMSNTVRIFLGTRLECAQCHDHPYDKWTQRDYFEMVAFTGGMVYGNGNGNGNQTVEERKRMRGLKEELGEDYFKVRRLLGIANLGAFGSGTGLARLPEGFLGSDGKENEVVIGKTMFEKEELVDAAVPGLGRKGKRAKKPKKGKRQQVIQGAKHLQSREAYAKWMTSSENPRFAMTIANRLWKQAFGLALIEPVDVIDDTTEASNEPLMQYLTQTVKELNFDRKQFLRAIYNSRTYQSKATADDIADPSTHAFGGPIVRRMTAEQIWDSLLVLTIPDVDQRVDTMGKVPGQNKDYSGPLQMASSGTLTIDSVIEHVKNGPKGNGMMEAKNERKAVGREMRDVLKSLNRQIRTAQKKQNPQQVKTLMLERAEKMQTLKSSNSLGTFKRASELASPAPAGHFLRQFGQSDRDQIQNANTDPAVTQVLSMMNGMIENQIVKDPNTVLMSNLLKSDIAATNTSASIETVFLTMLNRRPNRKEISQWKNDLRGDFQNAYSDLIWTLANSNEFIFIK